VLVVTPHSLSGPCVREHCEALLRQAVEDPSRRLIPELGARIDRSDDPDPPETTTAQVDRGPRKQ
jgi:hypothetical protein